VGDSPWRSNAAGASKPLQHNQASLWQRLYDAAALAPHKASQIAAEIAHLLDIESPEEARFAGLLDLISSSEKGGEAVSCDEQAAADLLGNARRLIGRHRAREVQAELARMRQAGQISEQEYVAQLLRVAK
jgi:hypothetical protein